MAWEYIRSINYGKVEGNIPRWVLAAEKQIRRKYGGISSSLVNSYFYLKGRHFEHRLSFGSQGGSIVSIAGRKRRKGR